MSMAPSSFDRRSFLARTAALAAAGLGGAGAAWADDAGGHTLVANIVPEPQGLVGGIAISQPAVAISSCLFDALVEYDAEFKPRPALAQSWEEAPDGRSITFHLRRDVTWHDGRSFTSADVQFSLMALMKKVHPRGGGFYAALTEVVTPDPYTAVFRLERRAPVIWSVLGQETQMLPRHLYEGTDLLASPWNARPVGNGPFVFKEWVRGDYVLLERNPAYWDKSLPKLRRIRFRFIPDAGARAAALEAGEVQYTPLSPVPLADVPRLRGNRSLVVETRGNEANAPMFFFDFNLRRPQFQDVRVRRAFAHAIDRQALADKVWTGFAKPATGPVPSYQARHYTADVQAYPFDPGRAEKLLDEAGCKRGADGVRMRITHDPMPYGDEYRQTGEFLRESLRQVGIEVTLRNRDLPTFLRAVFTDNDYDTLNSFYAAYADPQIGVVRRFWSQAIKKGTPWSNASGYSSPRMDAIIAGIQSEGDPEKRRAHVVALQQLAQVDLPSITLLEQHPFRVFSSRLAGVNVFPDGNGASLKTVSFAS